MGRRAKFKGNQRTRTKHQSIHPIRPRSREGGRAGGVKVLLANVQTLALYIAACVEQMTVATLQLSLAAISGQHRHAGHVLPMQVQIRYGGGGRRPHGTAQKKKAPALTSDVVWCVCWKPRAMIFAAAGTAH